jgi:large subunit ribosomal protein L25
MASIIPLKAEIREGTGKGVARSLRRLGRIPAIIYGKDKETIAISIDENEARKLYRKANFCALVMDIDVGSNKYKVLPRSVQLHPVTDIAEHIDFMHLSEGSEVRVIVHLHFLNEDKCIGLKRGGMLNLVKRDLELMCAPNSIPHHIDIDIANLNIGDSLHIEQVILPEGVRVINVEQNFTIATIVGRVKDEADAKTGAETATK